VCVRIISMPLDITVFICKNRMASADRWTALLHKVKHRLPPNSLVRHEPSFSLDVGVSLDSVPLSPIAPWLYAAGDGGCAPSSDVLLRASGAGVTPPGDDDNEDDEDGELVDEDVPPGEKENLLLAPAVPALFCCLIASTALKARVRLRSMLSAVEGTAALKDCARSA